MNNRSNLLRDLVLPMLLFGALGGMTWAVRGCSGFGASAGCMFAGVTLGTAWWFIAREPGEKQSRRYASGWIILAMTVGFGIAGNRGWMQWPSFFRGELQLNGGAGEVVPIDSSYGFLWMFIAGVPWAGMGACLLAWCAYDKPMPAWMWARRLALGIGGMFFLSRVIYFHFPSWFLPLYDTLHEQYQIVFLTPYDKTPATPDLWKLVRDNREAMEQMGLYLGFVAFEVLRRDWRNVTLMLTVGVLNGIGWSLLQNWNWAPHVWPGSSFNFWRCWESSGGISIGLAFGVAYFLVNRRMTGAEMESVVQTRVHGLALPGLLDVFIAVVAIAMWCATEIMWVSSACTFGAICIAFGYLYSKTQPDLAEEHSAGKDGGGWLEDPNLERWGAYLGLILGMGISIQRGLKGFSNIYLQRFAPEGVWNDRFWYAIFPILLVCLFVISALALRRSYQRGNVFPRAYAVLWFVLIVQNIIAQMITSSFSSWVEEAFAIYYIGLFVLTGAIVHYYYVNKKRGSALLLADGNGGADTV